jgi:hypothetical protein
VAVFRTPSPALALGKELKLDWIVMLLAFVSQTVQVVEGTVVQRFGFAGLVVVSYQT